MKDINTAKYTYYNWYGALYRANGEEVEVYSGDKKWMKSEILANTLKMDSWFDVNVDEFSKEDDKEKIYSLIKDIDNSLEAKKENCQ